MTLSPVKTNLKAVTSKEELLRLKQLKKISDLSKILTSDSKWSRVQNIVPREKKSNKNLRAGYSTCNIRVKIVFRSRA